MLCRAGPGAPFLLHSEWVIVAAGEKGLKLALASSVCQPALCIREKLYTALRSLTDAPLLTNLGVERILQLTQKVVYTS